MTSGSIPDTAQERRASLGVRPRRSASEARINTTAAAPSLMPAELPAVTVPSFLKTGFSFPSTSGVVPGRGCSSRTTGSEARGGSIGTISGSKCPASIAATARSWLRAANSSCSSRDTS